MKTIKLPFGLNENNILIHIADVERGKECHCVCPSCKSPLIAAKGCKKQPHFKHAVVNECKGGMESAIHLAAKQIIMKKKEITLSKYICMVSAKDSRGEKHKEEKTIVEDKTVITFDSVQEEVKLHDIKVDILAKKGNKSLIIEIFYCHKVEEQKREKIERANISAIEINLSDLTLEDIRDWETFWKSINNPKRIQWLHNAKAHDIDYPELEKQLAIKIQAIEEKYKQEDIRKQRKEQREKEQLLQALDEVKALSSKESIEQLKQKAETHPIWKYHSKYLPFSWNELPDFVNADVPNGDWIFGCDRRIWQASFYSSFIWNNDKPFCVKNVDRWLQNKVGCKVSRSVKIVGIYSQRYLHSADIYANLPSSWKTLRLYFYYLCELEMLRFSGNNWHEPGNSWFQVISKNPKSSTE
jgi:hypothetical protein